MFKNPLVRLAARATFVGLGAFFAALSAKLPGVSFDDIIFSLNVGYGFAMTYVGLGVFTPLEPTVGPKG